MNRFIILFLFSLGILSTCVFAVEVIPLNEGWNFHRGFQAPASEIVKVTLPHTWNAGDGMFGNADYYRGLCNYSRKLSVPAHYRGKRFFLKVMAAQTVADIFIDHYFVMQHKGGYTAFVAELTDFLVPGKKVYWKFVSAMLRLWISLPFAVTSICLAGCIGEWSCW